MQNVFFSQCCLGVSNERKKIIEAHWLVSMCFSPTTVVSRKRYLPSFEKLLLENMFVNTADNKHRCCQDALQVSDQCTKKKKLYYGSIKESFHFTEIHIKSNGFTSASVIN